MPRRALPNNGWAGARVVGHKRTFRAHTGNHLNKVDARITTKLHPPVHTKEDNDPLRTAMIQRVGRVPTTNTAAQTLLSWQEGVQP